MDLNWWSVLALASKWAGYLGTAAAIGGPFALILLFRSGVASSIPGYSLRACAVGGLAAVAGFFVQVGSFADQGISGMFDPSYSTILWQSAVGKAALFKVVGFCLVAAGLVWIGRMMRRDVLSRWAVSAAGVAVVFGIGSLAASFQYVGHTADASVLARAAISFHVIAMGLWVGSLYPLWLACRTSHLAELQTSMRRYGDLAIGFVGLLALCGVFLLFVLFDSVTALLTSPYGWGLLIKLALVSAMLLIAASNKWLWVAALLQQGTGRHLSRSIGVELTIALMILLVTAFITTFVGPPH